MRVEGIPIRLPAPYAHMAVQYPFEWANPESVYVYNEREGTGVVYDPGWARALADGIIAAFEAWELP